MSWVKLDDGFPDHRKQLAAGAAACWLWVCGIAYCNRQKQKDGFIPAAKVALLYPMSNTAKLAASLVKVGLWEVIEGGFVVHDYHDYQPKAENEEATSARKSAAGRLGGLKSGESRRSKTQQAIEAACFKASEAEAKHAASLLPKPVPSRPGPDQEPPVAPRGSGVELSEPDEHPALPMHARTSLSFAVGEAYAEAIRAATASTFALSNFAILDLVTAINGHCPRNYSATQVLEWVELNAGAYVVDRPRSQFEDGWSPRKFLAWCNGLNTRSLERDARSRAELLAASEEPEPAHRLPLEETIRNAELAIAGIDDAMRRAAVGE